MKKVFLFTGKKGSGKDTAAQILADHIDSTLHLSFAEKLKLMVWDHFKKKIEYKSRLWGSIHEKEEPIQGWTISKKHKEMLPILEDHEFWSGRLLLIVYGTDFFKETYKYVWIDGVVDELKATDAEHIFITDCRFQDEIEVIQNECDHAKIGCYIVKVINETFKDENILDHPSETELQNEHYDYLLVNNGYDKQIFRSEILEALEDIL